MTPAERSLLEACRAAPDDDLPRLVYADWLDEHCSRRGDPGWPQNEHGQSAKAEFIRTDLECERLGEAAPADLTDRRNTLLSTYRAEWEHSITCHVGPGLRIDWRRGLPVAARGLVSTFLEHGGRLRQLAPTIDTVAFSHILDPGAQQLAGCSHLAYVRHLDLSGCGIGYAGVRALADSPHVGVLRSIDLSENRIGLAAARALAASRLAAHIESIDLSGNPVANSSQMRQLLSHSPFPPDMRLVLNDFDGSFADFQRVADRQVLRSDRTSDPAR